MKGFRDGLGKDMQRGLSLMMWSPPQGEERKALPAGSPLSLFRKSDVFHTFSVIFVLSDYRKCTEELRFSKKQRRTAQTALQIWCTVSLSSLVTFFKGKCIQLARIT